MNIDAIIDNHKDAYRRAEALLEAQQDWVLNGGSVKTAQQAINDTLGMRAKEASEDYEDETQQSILTTLYVLNQWIVKKTVSKYANDPDIEAAALLGLWVACTRFKPGRGSFYGYAQNYILFETTKAAAESRHDSFYEWRNTPAVRTAIEKLEKEGALVTPSAVAQKTGLSVAVCARIMNPMRTTSIHSTVGDPDSSTTYEEVIPDSSPSPDLQFEANELQSHIATLVSELDPHVQEVMISHYGLDGRAPEHLSTIVSRTGWSKSNVSQWHQQGLQALKQTLGEGFGA